MKTICLMSRLLLIVLMLAIFFAVGMRGCASQAQTTDEFGPQIVFTVDHSSGDHKFVVPKAMVWYNIIPLSKEQHYAPLNQGDTMLCRAHDIKATNGTFVGLRCGLDDYIIQGVGMKAYQEK